MTILPNKPKKVGLKDRAEQRELRDRASAQGSSLSDRSKAHPYRRQKKPLSPDTGREQQAPLAKKSVRGSQSPAANSDDEYDQGFKNEALEAEFVNRLKQMRGFDIKEVQGDGSCLFRAISYLIYGGEDFHEVVRKNCMDHMAKNRDHFEPFITEDFETYIARKRCHNVHGNHVEIQAISEIYMRPVEIYEYSDQPINIFHPHHNPINEPLRLSYHGSTHYNAVVDPFHPTFGVGLGLPGLVAGAADHALITDALRQSETLHIEESMLKDKMSMSDWQKTEEEIKQQVSRESFLEYIRSLEANSSKAKNGARSSKSACDQPGSSKSCISGKIKSPKRVQSPVLDCNEPSTSQSSQPPPRPGLYEELLAAQALAMPEDMGFDDDALLAEALLLSSQETSGVMKSPSATASTAANSPKPSKNSASGNGCEDPPCSSK
ncbi:hypothetical protein WR25_23555 [Diploscapter pachys]|uniref:ubiquitinyl hydrolase 1 n=1 Tax=Diploscapter pachys TaxID=2018661 RepID=A0A2A2KJU6_9BILA|nr:hypothetical protein WR25_23555 [Diploscapter pachys]